MTTTENWHPEAPTFFTWFDVEQWFRDLAAEGEWPEWLVEVDAYWDSLELTLDQQVTFGQVWDYLGDTLGRLTVDREAERLLLEDGGVDGANGLDVVLTRAAPDHDSGRRYRRPKWNENRVTREVGEALPRPNNAELPHGVNVAAFHSFKGGVGRTTHCVATARAVAASGQRVLLVDADLEAPGITWMLEAQGNRITFSFEDFLALLHGADEPDRAVAVARRHLANQEIDGVLLLPARRDPNRTEPPRLAPGDLLTPSRSRYFLTESLARLAHALGAGTALVDLRAGASELSAPALLDPRVHRVFVTTASDQSVRGTVAMLDEVRRRAPSTAEDDPVPTVIVTQYQNSVHDGVVEDAAARLAEAVTRIMKGGAGAEEMAGEEDPTTELLVTTPLRSPFSPGLLALPASWDGVAAASDRAGLGRVVAGLADNLRAGVTPEPVADVSPSGRPSLPDRRRWLAERARLLTYAETAMKQDEDAGFLRTNSLVNLASAHRTEAPVEVVVGAKGSGKTFTFLSLCRRRTWGAFGADLGVRDIELDADIVPVLSSQYLKDDIGQDIDEIRRSAANRLASVEGAEVEVPARDPKEFIDKKLKEDRTDGDWRRIWLTVLARSVGIPAEPDTAEDDLVELARRRSAIFVVDGLEDLFQGISREPRQQQALRVLLTTCMEWMRKLRGRPLGLVIFVRRDLVQYAITQNTAQFLARYQQFELRWDQVEALRLVAWVCHHSRALPMASEDLVQSAGHDVLSEHLLSLWGERLGSARSREAGSQAWFLAALSDFNQQIQARDIVFFLKEAAEKSADDPSPTKWTDRLLTPTSMRRALPACSAQKIFAIQEEIRTIKEVFDHMRTLDHEGRKVPFRREDVGLSLEDIALLESNGVVFLVENEYWMPEIYRHGLNFKATTRRPRVLGVAKLVRGSSPGGAGRR
ncbi:MinD/ParA family ATP-binding protein [Actinoalloteichus caeruleus]|uniref:MinD/ParA family ATP-binding protein n=1 Tax=Actinoalloteichus cyanogriseus TaxID=2893586 RepID=UPI003BB90EA6